jgi:FlaA1/EpsC-like NDP-sugar epimerase
MDNKLSEYVLNLPRLIKRSVVMIVDILICFLSVYIAYYLRLGEWCFYLSTGDLRPWVVILTSIVIGIPMFYYFGLYREIFRYSGSIAFLKLTKVGFLYSLLIALIFLVVGIQGVPRTIGIIQPFIMMALVIGSRASAAYWLGNEYRRKLKMSTAPRALIYGAGKAGMQLAGVLLNSSDIRIIGFVDDDPNLQGSTILGRKIYSPSRLLELSIDLNISEVLLAIPSASRINRNKIIQHAQDAKLRIRTLPSIGDIATGKISFNDLHPLDIDDLLGRDVVPPDLNLMAVNTRNKTILVTGAGGSIGSELCRQILMCQPVNLVMVDQSEFALYQIHQELINKYSEINAHNACITPILTTVLNESRMRSLIGETKPHIIYHAAAYKHVPLVEDNILDGILNNTIGTLKIAKIAEELDVPHFVLISTDKAVRPTNVMGATKRLSEMILQALDSRPNNTKFSMVRFGNVLDSSGSVVPKFRQQIEDGGPITVTNFEMTRFFMTIPEAAQLVMQAGALSDGGDVFLLNMGVPVKIVDLARKMIRLSGLNVKDVNNPDGDIEIREVGSRPGEKLFEELLIDGDAKPTPHPKIFRAHENFLPWDILDKRLTDLINAIRMNNKALALEITKDLVPSYISQIVFS